MDKYRSTLNPITLIVNVVLYVALLVLGYFESDIAFYISIAMVVFFAITTTRKFVEYKYFLDDKGLYITHKGQKANIQYKNIKYVEVNSKQTGMIYGFGYNRLLVVAGKGIEEYYLITPAKEKDFLEKLEKKVKEAKKNTK